MKSNKVAIAVGAFNQEYMKLKITRLTSDLKEH